ncbi:hypothetical protein [Dyadobacter pollutisoli]|jgi:hypothetical protein|uniref:Addiction module protein n=1 Tax=Dyadobacter pollutisoli TaxID=2910158 RepID=A0A9E8NBG7_9BACT|nr:hypothetical protein [Dyadobacter pollutisoli]WAC11977.1 hypothetical protein ON006_30140 [Dyadobacter pollutisoli]
MVSLNISINQLVDVIRGLDEIEKIQVKRALENEFFVSDETREELLSRKQAFQDGKITSRSWEEIKSEHGSL